MRRYLHFKSDHPKHVKRGVVHSFVNIAKVICQEQNYFEEKKIKTIKQDLILTGYLQDFINSTIKSGRNNRPSTDSIPHSSVVVPYIKSTSEKFQCIGNHFNTRTIFKTKQTLQRP